MTARLLGYDGPHLLPIAAVTEFVHTASLLHDDVVDNSTLRRNRPTANSVYGDVTSVLVGDLIYSTASEMMAATGDMEIVRTFARAIRLMSDGELLQLENLYRVDLPEATYLRILECKTAILIEAACKAAALLAHASEAHREALCRFGHSVGMAFQLIDDAHDYLSDSTLLGKGALSDLPEGKVTMPLLLLRDVATPVELGRLAELIRGRAIDAAAMAEVQALVLRYETAEATVARAEVFTGQAMSALAELPASSARDALEGLARQLLLRFN
jgi:octaprenyl-diphosphate synthase